ncbi:MAG: GTPase HflX [Phycisphaerales bacterium]|nr:GTPase HflX [Phycisphaerales bacterium]
MPKRKDRETIQVAAERAVLAAVRLPTSRYDHADPFGELRALAEQAGATIVGELTQSLDRPVAGTFIGSGKLRELADLCRAVDASTVIFDHDLSPKQLATIEEETGRKVIDRSELILDIFAGRATSYEAKLQVELAQLEYTYPRLRAMWDHLERIVGGGAVAGIGTRGPGEQQLEIDRRLVQRRRVMLSRELAEIQDRKRREVQARKTDFFTIGIVGYTNAGKSTLFNTLTAGGAYADDRVFATLISRTRQWDLGGGVAVMLSDTVGFVRDLPHNLVASFRATLEEATHADLLLIVLDVADPAASLHYDTVNQTLDSLMRESLKQDERRGLAGMPPAPRILLLNKVDRLRDNRDLLVWQQRVPGCIPIIGRGLPPLPQGGDGGAGDRGCAIRNDGLAELTARVREAARGPVDDLLITVPLADSRTIHTIENRAEVAARDYDADSVTLRARIGRRQLDQLRAAGARMKVEPAAPVGHAKPARATKPARGA